MAEGVPGRPATATTRKVSGEDWYGEDLTGRSEHGVEFVDVDLTESTSTAGLVFDQCTFRHVKFNVSVHRGAAFVNCRFSVCNFFDASFTECKFVGSVFERCTYDQLTVSGGDLSFVGLPGADLRSASISGARMREADLTGARCDGATLRRLDLSGAMLAKASFDGADLRGSDLSALDPRAVSLHGAIVDWQQAVTIATSLGLDVRPDDPS
jgi:uncharacterized protein YjbI with pentapeptide repeats